MTAFNSKGRQKISHWRTSSPKYVRLCHFTFVVLQRRAKKCAKIQNARAEPLFCWTFCLVTFLCRRHLGLLKLARGEGANYTWRNKVCFREVAQLVLSLIAGKNLPLPHTSNVIQSCKCIALKSCEKKLSFRLTWRVLAGAYRDSLSIILSPAEPMSERSPTYSNKILNKAWGKKQARETGLQPHYLIFFK